MAHPKAAAYPAQTTPHPANLAANVVDTIDDIHCHCLAFEAVEGLMSLQKAGSTEDLAHIDRTSLAWLLTILNVNLRQQIDKARAAADVAYHQARGD